MTKESGYVGRYGDALRKLTALDASAGKFAPQQIGGADTGGFGPSLQVGPSQPGPSGFDPQPQPQAAQPQPQAAATTPTSGFGAEPAQEAGSAFPQPSIMSDDPTQGGISGSLPPPADAGGLSAAGASPIATGGDKPTSFHDLTRDSTPEQREEMAKHLEQSSGQPLKSMWQRVKEGLGLDKAPKFGRGEMALYLSEVALRAMSKRSDPRYAQNPDGVFADALLETQADYEAKQERTRKEKREDDETLRKEKREDTIHTRTRAEQDSDYKRNRADKEKDDAKDFEQRKELAKLQAKLLKDKGQKTQIVTAEDGTLKLIDRETGEAVPVTENVTTTTTRGSRGMGTSTTTTTQKKPVKVPKKADASGLDRDTVQRMISDRIKELAKSDRNFRKKTPEEQSKIATKLVMDEVNSVNGGAAANPFDEFDTQQE